MCKSINRTAAASLILAIVFGACDASAQAETMPLPKARPAAVPIAAPAVTPAPVQLVPQSVEQIIDTHSVTPTSGAAIVTALPQAKPGLPPLTAITATVAPATVALPKVIKTTNDIDAKRGTLKQALDALDKYKSNEAVAIYKGMKPSLDRSILTYILTIGAYRNFPASEIKRFYDQKTNWPSRSLTARRIEEAVARQVRTGKPLAGAFGNTIPKSTTAAIEVAISQAMVGNKKQAARIIRPIWRSEKLNAKTERKILSAMRSLLTNNDHFQRASFLLYHERATGANRLNKYLTADQRKYVEARTAVIRQQKSASAKLKAVPKSLRSDPGYVFSRIQYLRRKGNETAAADVMINAPRAVEKLINHREWWIERRLMSRIMLNKGDARRAYLIAARHTAQSSKNKSEAEFHAGFFALRYLHDHKTAAIHFERSWKVASRDRDKSRGLYWQGRAWETAGDRKVAEKFYKAAANPTVYYGQLAMEEIGQTQMHLSNPPAADAGTKTRFNGRELVKAIKRLKAVGHEDRAGPIFRHLARTLDNPSEVLLLHQMAQSYGQHQEAVQIGQIALNRHMPAQKMAFPLNVIPRGVKTNGIDIALIYALTKQESVFNIGAVSHANARGLMQMLPATAKRTARSLGVKYSKSRLTRDPKYAVLLGSAFLKKNLETFNGSLILTFAGYNAGPGRPPQWIERFGDPRTNEVSAIDWVERIPFTETRDYVMKLIENLQVYEARIHGKGLDISADLKRGHP
ncbi:soluble lytic murein transglycosylase [Cohaesibacter sp. ES.047]|uniref:lytic transglycosylase domain-containing protein n=1 Tax=Cohaesibacter sp. ES.047 TaxID=1798205 RepID=UPI000BB71C92|nr:lytic transglycosylase domain-containing protein [Cohaesibacter sp. ES.047]SNY94149.1 soluble lytic murein transglycosylase [Cohaesibacter sp. ES.047]